MKNILCISVLIAALPLGVLAGKGGGKLQTLGATLNVPPTVTPVSGGLVPFSGSGYWAGKATLVEVQGPVHLYISTVADGHGNINASTGMDQLIPGYYSASSYQAIGNKQILMATTGFEVE
jgi:hypothetical protein